MQQGLSRTTVAKLRDQYYNLAGLAHTDKSNPRFLTVVNEILEYLYSLGDWRGNSGVWSFTPSSSGRITLPYYLQAMKAARLDDHPRPILAQNIEFLHNGPGDLEDRGLGVVVSDGEHPISAEFPEDTSDTISVSSTNSDDETDKFVRIYGLDENGNEVRGATGSPGEKVAVGATSTSQFSAVTHVVKDLTRGRVSLTLDTATPLVLAVYEPTIEIPAYHRYKVDPVSSSANSQVETVTAWCSRRFIPVAKEEDFVVPGAMRAWKLAFQAWSMENEADKNADAYWVKALQAFNADVENFKRSENQPMNLHLHGYFVEGLYAPK